VQTLAKALIWLAPRSMPPLCYVLLPFGAVFAYLLTLSLLVSIILPSFFWLLVVRAGGGHGFPPVSILLRPALYERDLV
jgi:hypothetical protein